MRFPEFLRIDGWSNWKFRLGEERSDRWHWQRLGASGQELGDNYEAVRDFMLETEGDAYHVKTYAKSLFDISAGSRSAAELFKYMYDLKAFYERARKRALKWQGVVFPEIPVSTLAYLYKEALPPAIRVLLPWEGSRSDEPQYFYEIAIWCKALEQRLVSETSTTPPPPQQQPPAKKKETNPQPEKKRGVAARDKTAIWPCVHCGEKGHFLKDCAKWKKLRVENPAKAKYCPKCLQGEHSFRNCKEKIGRCWKKFNEAKASSNPAPAPKASSVTPPSPSRDSERVPLQYSPPSPVYSVDLDPWGEPYVPIVSPRKRLRGTSVDRESRMQTQENKEVLRNSATAARAVDDGEVEVLEMALERAKARRQFLQAWTAEHERAYLKAYKEYTASRRVLSPECEDYACTVNSAMLGGNIDVPTAVTSSEASALFDAGSARRALDNQTADREVEDGECST